MNPRTRALFIGSSILLVVVFLGGFIPQYRRAGRLEAELAAQRERLRTLESNARFATGAHLASALYLESSRLNYGTASELAGEFFNHVRSLIGVTADASTRGELEEIAKKRDQVVAALARGDATVQTDVREILQKFLGIVRRQAPA